MNSPSNAIPETSVRAQTVESATIPASRIFLWSVKRELWERRSIYIAPLAVAAVLLLGDFISTVRLPAKMRLAMTLDPMKQHIGCFVLKGDTTLLCESYRPLAGYLSVFR